MEKLSIGSKATSLLAVLACSFLLAAVMPIVSAENIELRGSVTNLGVTEFTYDNTNFAGFYYDIDKNLGKEQITFTPTGDDPAAKTLSDQEPRGIVYTTTSQPKNFKSKPWGQYEVIAFLSERYFAAYDAVETAGMTNAGETVAYLFDKSKNRNLMTNEQIARILIDDNKEQIITSRDPLKLAEGYELALMFVNGTQAVVELKKNNVSIDTKIIQPSITEAKMADKTYYYKADLGDTKEIVQIAVHFKNCVHGPDKDLATVDGVFQISDTVTPLKSEQQYGKMSIRKVEPTTLSVTMDNKDNQITLSKNKDIPLMGKIHIKTADQDTINADTPLRYYIYSEETCECG
jgi:S-layer protein (TIGR01567 family)